MKLLHSLQLLCSTCVFSTEKKQEAAIKALQDHEFPKSPKPGNLTGDVRFLKMV